MESRLEQIREAVHRAFAADSAFSAVEAKFIAAVIQRTVDRVQDLVVDFKSWSGGEPPCDFDQINTYVIAALPEGLYSEDDARRLLRDWGKAAGNFR